MNLPTAHRPSGMAQIGDHYFPAGLPSGSSAASWQTDWRDPAGRSFSICYTEDQIVRQARPSGVFSPYLPLLTAGS